MPRPTLAIVGTGVAGLGCAHLLHGSQDLTVFEQADCHPLRYDYPGDAAWLGTFGDWRQAKQAFDAGQSDLARLGITRLGKEWILPVSSNKVTKQAAIIADLEPGAAEKLCADYQARKLFCQVKKSTDLTAPFSGFWR